MSLANPSPPRIPHRCPACGKVLYSSRLLRPDPSMSRRGLLIVLAGAIIGTILYVCTIFYFRERWATRMPLNDQLDLVHYPPTKLLVLIALPVAIVPAAVLGWCASRLPRIRRVRCWNCGWSKQFPHDAKFDQPEEKPAATSAPREWPAIVEEADSWGEAKAWVSAELRQRRDPDAVVAELVSQGWPQDDVELMVEKTRKAIRGRG